MLLDPLCEFLVFQYFFGYYQFHIYVAVLYWPYST
jgi:hypothetical protein